MPDKLPLKSTLQGKRIAVPESRQLDVLVDLFERRGAAVLRVPLVSILDAPDQAPVRLWLQAFIASPPDYLIVLTGEGLRRLRAAAQREGVEEAFVASLDRVCKICRGPKPGRALKELGLKADLLGTEPTTAGIIATLRDLPLRGSRMAVQLYGEDPNVQLMEFLASRELQDCTTVAPYVYASDAASAAVVALIGELVAGRVDLIAFTSQPQVHRLFRVATAEGLEGELRKGLELTRIAAIGPVVGDVLQTYDCRVDVMPESSFFMKPLVSAAEKLFA